MYHLHPYLAASNSNFRTMVASTIGIFSKGTLVSTDGWDAQVGLYDLCPWSKGRLKHIDDAPTENRNRYETAKLQGGGDSSAHPLSNE